MNRPAPGRFRFATFPAWGSHVYKREESRIMKTLLKAAAALALAGSSAAALAQTTVIHAGQVDMQVYEAGEDGAGGKVDELGSGGRGS